MKLNLRRNRFEAVILKNDFEKFANDHPPPPYKTWPIHQIPFTSPFFCGVLQPQNTLILIRISMIPRIVLLFYKSPLFMETREKISNENNVHFIYKEFNFSCTRGKLEYHESFHEGSYDILLFVLESECYCTHNFCKINSVQDGAKT